MNLPTIKAKEPALWLFIYLHRQPPPDKDMRPSILRQVEAFVDSRQLQVPENSKAAHKTIAEIDLSKADSLHVLSTILFEARRVAEDHSGATYEVAIYTYHDSIIIQLLVARSRNWHGTLKKGWKELRAEFQSIFGNSLPSNAEPSVFGTSAVYWTMSEDEASLESFEPEIRHIMGDSATRTETDLGPLRCCEFPFFANTSIHQDLWVLVTHRDAETEVSNRYYQLAGASPSPSEVSNRYYQLGSGPPPFGEVALARHKIFFELAQHYFMRKVMEDRGKVLERETYEFLSQQRRLGPKLDELASQTAIEFEEKLTQATNRLAAYRSRLGRLREVQRTLEVNRRNYTIHCLRLISMKKFAEVERSQNRLSAAIKAIDDLENDGIFSADLGLIAQHCQQVETDIGYSESVADRHTSALRSASDQLRIAGEREIAEMARHMAVDSAAVVASVAALVVIELAVKQHFDTTKDLYVKAETPAKIIKHPPPANPKGRNASAEHPASANPGVRNSGTDQAHTLQPSDEHSITEQTFFLHSLEGWFLVGWVILFVYGLTHAFGARFRGDKPGFKSIVTGFALASGWLQMFYLHHVVQMKCSQDRIACFIEQMNHLPEKDLNSHHWWLVLIWILWGALTGLIIYLGAWYGLHKKRRRKLLTQVLQQWNRFKGWVISKRPLNKSAIRYGKEHL